MFIQEKIKALYEILRNYPNLQKFLADINNSDQPQEMLEELADKLYLIIGDYFLDDTSEEMQASILEILFTTRKGAEKLNRLLRLFRQKKEDLDAVLLNFMPATSQAILSQLNADFSFLTGKPLKDNKDSNSMSALPLQSMETDGTQLNCFDPDKIEGLKPLFAICQKVINIIEYYNSALYKTKQILEEYSKQVEYAGYCRFTLNILIYLEKTQQSVEVDILIHQLFLNAEVNKKYYKISINIANSIVSDIETQLSKLKLKLKALGLNDDHFSILDQGKNLSQKQISSLCEKLKPIYYSAYQTDKELQLLHLLNVYSQQTTTLNRAKEAINKFVIKHNPPSDDPASDDVFKPENLFNLIKDHFNPQIDDQPNDTSITKTDVVLADALINKDPKEEILYITLTEDDKDDALKIIAHTLSRELTAIFESYKQQREAFSRHSFEDILESQDTKLPNNKAKRLCTVHILSQKITALENSINADPKTIVAKLTDFIVEANNTLPTITDTKSRLRQILINTQKKAFDKLQQLNNLYNGKFQIDLSRAKIAYLQRQNKFLANLFYSYPDDVNAIKSFFLTRLRYFKFFRDRLDVLQEYQGLFKKLTEQLNGDLANIDPNDTDSEESIINKANSLNRTKLLEIIKTFKAIYHHSNTSSKLKSILNSFQNHLINITLLSKSETGKLDYTSDEISQIYINCIDNNLKDQLSQKWKACNVKSEDEDAVSDQQESLVPMSKAFIACKKFERQLASNKKFTKKDIFNYLLNKRKSYINDNKNLKNFYYLIYHGFRQRVLAAVTLQSGLIEAKKGELGEAGDYVSALPTLHPGFTLITAGSAYFLRREDSKITEIITKDLAKIDELPPEEFEAFRETLAITLTMNYCDAILDLTEESVTEAANYALKRLIKPLDKDVYKEEHKYPLLTQLIRRVSLSSMDHGSLFGLIKGRLWKKDVNNENVALSPNDIFEQTGIYTVDNEGNCKFYFNSQEKHHITHGFRQATLKEVTDLSYSEFNEEELNKHNENEKSTLNTMMDNIKAREKSLSHAGNLSIKGLCGMAIQEKASQKTQPQNIVSMITEKGRPQVNQNTNTNKKKMNPQNQTNAQQGHTRDNHRKFTQTHMQQFFNKKEAHTNAGAPQISCFKPYKISPTPFPL